MPNESHSQRIVNWAKQNVPQPVRIRLLGGTRLRMLAYVLLFSVPFLIVSCQSYVKLSGFAKDVSWWGILFLGFVLLIPAGMIVLVGVWTRRTLVESLDAAGVSYMHGRRFRWEDLSYVDHVSKITSSEGATRKIEDNQLELVFSNGRVIIPPLIHDREQVWALVNSMPAQMRDDGQARATRPAPGSSAAPSFDDIVKAMGEMKAQHDRAK